MKKRILYDYQMFKRQQIGGVSRYFAELLRSRCHNGVENSLSIRKSLNFYLEQNDRYSRVVKKTRNHYKNFLLPIEFRGKRKLYRKYVEYTHKNQSNKEKVKKALRGGHFDIFHPTYYDPYFIEALKQRTMVLTVFDMIHEKFPDYFPLNDHTTTRKKQLCERANHIVAISHSTKADLVELFDIDPNKITVIHLANSLESPRETNELMLPQNYILFVGSRLRYKNFDTFYRSMIPLLKQENDLHLVCTEKPFTAQELAQFEVDGVGRQIVHHLATDGDLYQLYERALCFVYPSLYEGFGLPLLEAFSAGCPVISSKGGSLPEVGGKAALYIDPLNEKDIRGKIEEVISSTNTRKRLRKLGLERLKTFSWDRCRKEHADLYKSLQ